MTLHSGDTVHVSKGYPASKGKFDQIYVYTGPTLSNYDLETADYTTGNWHAVAGVKGAVYKFMGATGTSVDLSTGIPAGVTLSSDTPNYTALDYWYEMPESQLLPSGFNIKGRAASRSAAPWRSTRCMAVPAPMCSRPI